MAFPSNPSPGQTHTEDNTTWVYAGPINGWYRQSVNPGNATDYRTGDGYVGSDLDVVGDITLDDGGTYATTLQLITPTANRTISFPDATGTVGLVGGSSGQLVYNNAGAYAGAPSTSVGATGNITLSLAGAASTPPVSLTGTWFSGGTSTTTKPQLLIEPTGTTSTAWSTSGTGLGVNAASGFGGNLLDLQVNGTSRVVATSAGLVGIGTSSPTENLTIYGASPRLAITGGSGSSAILLGNQNSAGINNPSIIEAANGALYFGGGNSWSGGGTFDYTMTLTNDNKVGIGTTSPQGILETASSSASNVYLTSTGGNSNLRIVAQDGGVSSIIFGDTSDAFTGGITFDHSDNSLQLFGNNYDERARIDSSGRLLVGTSTNSGGALLQVNGDRVRIATAKTPASATDTGTTGEVCWDADYIYVCTATNTWKRTAIATW